MNFSDFKQEIQNCLDSDKFYHADLLASKFLENQSDKKFTAQETSAMLNLLRRSPCTTSKIKWASYGIQHFPDAVFFKRASITAHVENGDYLIIYDEFKRFALATSSQRDLLFCIQMAKKCFDYFFCAELICAHRTLLEQQEEIILVIKKQIHLSPFKFEAITQETINIDKELLTNELSKNKSLQQLAELLLKKKSRDIVFDNPREDVELQIMIRSRFGNHFLLAYCLKDWSERRDPRKCELLLHKFSAYGNFRSCYEVSNEWLKQEPRNSTAWLNHSRFSDIIGKTTHSGNWPKNSSYESKILLLRHRGKADKHVPPQKPRVAVCISGQLRGFRVAGKSILSKVVEPLKADVFVATWDTIGTSLNKHNNFNRLCRIGSGDELLKRTLASKELFNEYLPATFQFLSTEHKISLDEITQFYGSVSTSVTNENAFNKEYSKHLRWGKRQNLLKMVYQIKKANDLKKVHEKKYGSYDYVLRLRPDKKIISFDLELAISKIRTNRTFCSHGLGWDSFFLGDQFFFCPSSVADSFAEMWNEIHLQRRDSDLPEHYRKDLKNEALFFDHTYGMGSDISIYPSSHLGRFINTPDPDQLFNHLEKDIIIQNSPVTTGIAEQIKSSVLNEINEN